VAGGCIEPDPLQVAGDGEPEPVPAGFAEFPPLAVGVLDSSTVAKSSVGPASHTCPGVLVDVTPGVVGAGEEDIDTCATRHGWNLQQRA